MRLLLPVALILVGAVTGLGMRALVRAALGRRRGGRAGPVALAAGIGALAGLWVRDALDVVGFGPGTGALLAAVAGGGVVGLATSLLYPVRRRR